MTTHAGAESAPGPRAPAPRLLLDVSTGQGICAVHVTGELDLCTSEQLVTASSAGHQAAVTIDLGGVTFMDGSGYSSLIASRHAIENDGRTLTITGQTGQPARLWKMIAGMDSLLPCA